MIYSFPDTPDADWTDRLLLTEEAGEWVLADVLCQDGGRLTDILVFVIEN